MVLEIESNEGEKVVDDERRLSPSPCLAFTGQGRRRETSLPFCGGEGDSLRSVVGTVFKDPRFGRTVLDLKTGFLRMFESGFSQLLFLKRRS